MGNRRFTQVSTSDEDDDLPPPSSRTRKSEENQQQSRQSKRKRIKLQEEEDEEQEEEKRKASRRERKRKGKEKEEEKPRDDNVEEEEQEEDQPQEDAKPVGEPVRLSGKGRGRRSHYEAFEFDGNRYELEDPVLLSPEDKNQKPYVAIIKDISQSKDGNMMVTGQWFYRPEEADRKGGGNWQSRDTRELFYSFHRDEVPAESVMHKCVVHFVPIHKQLPNRKQHPGFIVQKVYDTVERKLWKLTDKDYEDNKQHEIDLLVQKTRGRLGDLPDIEPEDAAAAAAARDQEDQSKTKRTLRKKSISPLDVSREEDATTRSDHHVKAETPGSCTSNASEYYTILAKFKALTGETHRDKWLERLLQGLQYMCNSPDSMPGDDNGKDGCDGPDHERDNKSAGTENGSQEKSTKNEKSFIWPDTAVSAVTALERASHDALSSDFQKYNQKLRQLVFNLKNNAVLARRLLNGELEPSKILNMSPNELKEGLTAEETAKKEPDESERMQMTDARCSRCNESKVGLRDIIQAGHGDRYQLECIACGYSWYASRDEASTLTIDGPSSAAKNVGAAPLATTKFESLEKKLLSPRESERSAIDVLKKSSEAYMPVLEAQRSFGRSKNEDNNNTESTITKKAD
ncbi:bromo-adjacent-likey (BAH) domain-containing protein [Melia azedarach]|uniref:Bromo-adjacent-likey (BAH) domain-containing protein n=1 Tax=Melia azedarach TaxID=155640 RepID=A0ACC1XL68_MELAZ|nr:bromo-adjacent-likey (BAH) domain-containing protein [Melia azedarach]